jgi:hypothetical protein
VNEPFAAMAAAADPVVDPVSDPPPGGEIRSESAEIPGVESYAIAAEPVVDPSVLFRQRVNVWKDELVAWFKTLASAAVYATLIVTFGFQVARVEGQSMAPTLSDQDRLIVNKFAYRMGAPRRGDIVMLYYPLNPDKSFVKRVIAEEDARRVRSRGVSQPRRFRPDPHPGRLLLRDGRPSEQQLRQPPLGNGAEEVHHRPGPVAVVADSACPRLLTLALARNSEFRMHNADTSQGELSAF